MRTFRIGLTAPRPLRLFGATLAASACGWLLVREVGRFPLALLCAAGCLGVLAGLVRRDASWERVLGPIVLGGGAAALGGRLFEAGYAYAAWPLFALALTAAVAGLREERVRWAVGLAVFLVIVPLVRWIVLLERGSLSTTLVAGALVASGAWLTAAVRIELVELVEPLPTEGPYRDTCRSRNAN